MTSKLSKAKVIQDQFSPEQPGQINVAGEVFFLNLPGQDQTDILSRLYDDSVKGDIAFQALFLGGLPIEDGGKHFTKIQQTDLRRIFRAVFGPKPSMLPTASKVKSLARMVIGKKGVVVPENGSLIVLPCDKKDSELMIKALILRRQKLIEQIQNYDALKVSDIHARYMRQHLKKLGILIDQQVPIARTQNKDCRYTGIIDPNASKPLALSDDRMRRLLEIFAFLLAQGKDPLRALSGRLPSPSDILPRLANPDAPDIYDYEDQYIAENPGKTPDYTQTILKIRKVLEGDEALNSSVVNEETKKTIKDVEDVLFPTNPGRSDGTIAERKERILELLKIWNDDKNKSIAETMGLTRQLGKKDAELAKCEADKRKYETDLLGLSVTRSEKEALEKLIEDLNNTILRLGNEKKELISQRMKEKEDKVTELETLVTGIRKEARMEIVKAEIKANKAKKRAEEAEKRAKKADLRAKEAEDVVTAVATTSEREGQLTSTNAIALKASQEALALATANSIAAREQVELLQKELEQKEGEKLAEITDLKDSLRSSRDQSMSLQKVILEKESTLTSEINILKSDNKDLSDTIATTRMANEAESAAIKEDNEQLTRILGTINTVLKEKGLSEMNPDDTPSITDSKLKQLVQRFNTPPPSSPLPGVQGQGQGQGQGQEPISLCLLNILFTMLKKLYISKRTDIATQKPAMESMFRSIDAKSASITDSDDSILYLFNKIAQNLKFSYSVGEERSLQGVKQVDKEIFKGHFNKLQSTIQSGSKLPERAMKQNRDMASFILRDFTGNDKDFARFFINENGTMVITESDDKKDGIDFATVFMYVLALTKKLLTTNSGALIKLGCDVYSSF